MVKFQTAVINEYLKVLQSAIGKQNPFSESLFLDFENGKIQFRSDIGEHDGSQFYGELKIAFEIENENSVDAIWVDGLTFLHLCKNYKTLTIDKQGVFRAETNEKFHLKTLSKDSFDTNENTDFGNFNFGSSFVVSEDLISKISKAINFAGAEYPNVCLVGEDSGSLIYSGNDYFYYEATTEDKLFDVQFGSLVIKLLSDLLGTKKEIRISYDSDRFYISTENIEIVSAFALNSGIIEYDNEENFRKYFMHSSILEFSKEEMLKALTFLEPFMRESSRKISITITNQKAVVRVEIEDYKAEKVISVIDYPGELENRKIMLISDSLKDSLTSIASDYICASIHETDTNLPISIEGENDMVVLQVAF